MATERFSKVLLVEDNEPERRLLGDILEEEGFEVISCESATEALRHIKHQNFGVAVVDLRLPDLSGTQLLEQVRAFDEHIRVIIYTGVASIDSIKEALNLGAFAYVEKLSDHRHLAGDRVADELAAGFRRGEVRIILPERPIVLAAQAHRPHRLAVFHRMDASLPHVLEGLRMGVVRIRNVGGPLESVQPDHANVVLTVDQPTPLGEHLKPFIGKGERAGNDRIATQPQQRFVHAVPHV